MKPIIKKGMKDSLQEQSEAVEQQEEAKEVEEKGYEVDYDSTLDTASVVLSSGTQITLKSPKAKALLKMQSWYENASEEYQSDSFAAMKLAHTCLINSNQSFDEFLESLEIEDIERVGAALTCFRNVFDKLKKP
ncbi:MAG: hypothetical protein KME13_18480 [Myxacorys californica WJT36-NPBG1]|jgi:hypothetical protein|nr:hypothetical protein [Myxacorys californica WJT36-NPBG1]